MTKNETARLPMKIIRSAYLRIFFRTTAVGNALGHNQRYAATILRRDFNPEELDLLCDDVLFFYAPKSIFIWGVFR